MDKNSLAQYGWLVVCVIILAIMITLATPFGTVIRNAVAGVVTDFGSTATEALDGITADADFDGIGGGTGGSGGSGGDSGGSEDPGMGESQPSTVSGSYISVNDVASANQPLTVSLTSNTVSDFSSVNVTRYGSNLIDVSAMLNENFTDNGDGTYTLAATRKYSDGRSSGLYDVAIPANVPFCVRATITENATVGDYCIYAHFYFEDGTYAPEIIAVDKNIPTAPTLKAIFSYPQAVTQIKIVLRYTPNDDYVVIGDYMTIKELKLNIGQELEYEAYKQPQTVSANSDGSVTGLTSTAPGMTLLTDTEGVTITCDYKKKK